MVSPTFSPPELLHVAVPKSEGKQLHATPTHDAGEFSTRSTTGTDAGGPTIKPEQGLVHGTIFEPNVYAVIAVLLVSKILHGSASEKSSPSAVTHPPKFEQFGKSWAQPEVADA
jgi:hypothetical protein